MNIDKNRCVGWWRTLVPTLNDLPHTYLCVEWFVPTARNTVSVTPLLDKDHGDESKVRARKTSNAPIPT